MSAAPVVVVGGGLAGITAALDCARAGRPVTLLESRGRLGGAAYSFERDGMRVDNGQHVFLRCCTAYRGLLDTIGAADAVVLQRRLEIPVRGPGGRRAALARTGLPAPLHLARSMASFGFLSVRERVAAALAMRALGEVDIDDPAAEATSFGAWLRRHRQSRRAIDILWDLVARPTLNLAVDDASLAQAAQVFQVGLLHDAAAADIGYAAVPLSEIHDRRAGDALRAAGVLVRTRTAATALRRESEGFAITLSDGAELSAAAVVLAVGPARAAALLPSETGLNGSAIAAGLGSSPIVNLHVVYDRPVLDVPFLAGVDGPVQWVFDRTESSGVRDGQYLAISLSAADDELHTDAGTLRERYLPALAALLPAARGATVRRFFVTREHAATFRAAPGARAWRPGPATRLAGLAVAGAWTDTGWPATMEGAVRSGHAAAEVVLDPGGPSGGATGRSTGLATGRSTGGATGRSSGGLAGEPAGDQDVLVLAPLSVEAAAARAAGWPRVRHTGMGARRSGRAASTLAGGAGPAADPGPSARAILVAGFCGALDDALAPGDVVLATELQAPGRPPVACADPAILAGVLRRDGLTVHVGPIASSPRLVTGAARATLRAQGALAVDMESAWLAAGAPAQTALTVLRVVVDTPRRELRATPATLLAALGARRTLVDALRVARETWRPALGTPELVLASPRASCAGVERAIEIVRRALEDRGAPVFVRRQIVHNEHVVAELEGRGAVFVEEVDEVPAGQTVIFSAHGVAPTVRERAVDRGLDVIDATCPLVAKVHAEARRFAGEDFDIVLVGHEGHEEVDGTLGEAPERTQIIATADQVGELRVRDPRRVAYLTQTTLAVDESAEVIEALRERFPAVQGPPRSDICYATQNRQDAVRALAEECDLVLVVGSGNSSNSRRLVEVAHRAGCRALLVSGGQDIPPSVLAGARRIGLTAGASAPEQLVQDVVAALGGIGARLVGERHVADEKISFKLPPQVRRRS